jgi:hypothetical protein
MATARKKTIGSQYRVLTKCICWFRAGDGGHGID